MQLNKIHHGNCLDVLKNFDDNSIDTIITDPPYGYSFMNKDWDKAVVSVDIWKECFRVLKWGAFAAVMSSPRQDVLARMIVNLQDAGFRTDFTSVYWTYASGFPKAANVSKLVDKRLGMERNKIISPNNSRLHHNKNMNDDHWNKIGQDKPLVDDNIAISEEAKALDGSYAGFQPKPAVEVILMVMKPLSEKTFVDQALSNSKGITWLDSCRIPFQDESDTWNEHHACNFTGSNNNRQTNGELDWNKEPHIQGRFPANLLVSDDVLNDGVVRKVGTIEPHHKITSEQFPNTYGEYTRLSADKQISYGDSGSYSRYFDLDSWSRVNLPVLFSGDISSLNNISHTFSVLLTWLFDHIQNKQLSHLGKGLYDELPSQIRELSSYTTLLDNRSHIILNHDVRALEDIFCKLLPLSVHNSLHNSLASNGVLDVQTLSSLLGFLGDYRFYSRLYDELLDSVSNLSLISLLLLIGVAEQIHSHSINPNQVDKHEDISRQNLAYAYTISYYRLLNTIYISTQNIVKTFPFLIVPKASSSEKNKGLDKWISKVNDGRATPIDNPFQRGETVRKNLHPTVKPLKLMSWLITLLTRPRDIVLDPFSGSGTTCLAAHMLKRNWIGIELNKEYIEIAEQRLKAGPLRDPPPSLS